MGQGIAHKASSFHLCLPRCRGLSTRAARSSQAGLSPSCVCALFYALSLFSARTHHSP